MKQAAVFIGVNNYRAPITSLRYARNDADELYQLFLQHYSRGLVKYLHDEETAPDNILETIDGVVSKLDEGDSFLLYFSGHGVQDHGNHLLLSATSRELGGEWINALSMNQLDALTARPGVNRLFIIDSCRSVLRDGARAVGAEAEARDAAIASLLKQKRARNILPPAIMCSCSRDEQTYEIDEFKHGVFTQAMLELADEVPGGLDLQEFSRRIGVKVSAILERCHLAGKQTPILECPSGKSMMIFSEKRQTSGGTAPEGKRTIENPENEEAIFRNLTKLKRIIAEFQKEHYDRDETISEHWETLQEEFDMAQEALKCDRFTTAENCLKRAQSEVGWIKKHAGEVTFTGKFLLPGNVPLELVQCPSGSFTMGSPLDEEGRFDDEKQHRVTLTKSYWIGKYEVTQAQYEALMKQNPSEFKSPDRPVENVNWIEAKAFCDELNELTKEKRPAGYVFDLPTEAQWEYACRAGTETALNSGRKMWIVGENNAPALDKLGWYLGNCGQEFELSNGDDISDWEEKQYQDTRGGTHPVGKKAPNAWGIYDMHGNVLEWCLDRYGAYSGDATDPTGATNGSDRVYRGGSWFNFARGCRAARRGSVLPDSRGTYLGFRVVLVKDK